MDPITALGLVIPPLGAIYIAYRTHRWAKRLIDGARPYPRYVDTDPDLWHECDDYHDGYCSTCCRRVGPCPACDPSEA